MKKAYFAAGCFWGVQYYFARRKGVTNTIVGFMGGHDVNPSYKEVKTGATGHLETIDVIYDENLVTYEDLVKYFFEIHDFEQTDGQGIDIGSQYLSAIFYSDESERETAMKIIGQLTQMGYKVATQVREAQDFYPAETYHQYYLDQRSEMPECHVYRPIFPHPKGSLEIVDKSSKMGMTLPHKIFFNGQLLGIMQRKSIQVKDIPAGKYLFKIQSMIPFISAERELDIKEGENKVTFSDKETFWDILFAIDIVLVIVKLFLHLPENIDFIYKVVTNGYFVLWLVYEWIIRKKYFKIRQD
ncbi:MAG: peptide-methionine (S)-S-oxide reductase MsrA [Bacteroidales bacterium]|nr:peptide-methionine (S)-S-oxide reductase MsrA [Bacteroidales bacterium]